MKGTHRSARMACRRCNGGVFARPLFWSTASSATTQSFRGISSIPGMEALKKRPAKFIPDYLVPMPSHLLSTTLADLIPSISTSSSSLFPPSSPATTSPPAALPQGHHLVYFPIQTPPSLLAPDGADLDHSPGPPFDRRLWAGGEVRFREGWARRLRMDGRAWACREEIGPVDVRGAEGEERVFVDVWRRYGLGHEAGPRREQDWDIEERRTLVFMRNTKDETGSPRAIKYPHPPTISHVIHPSPKHLFHFSALTFNAHAIHYDPVFARSVDAHRAPLVHGPLTLALMLRVLAAQLSATTTAPSASAAAAADAAPAAVSHISYRNYAPLYVGEDMRVCARRVGEGKVPGSERWDVWVEGPEGGMAVKGNVVVDLDAMTR